MQLAAANGKKQGRLQPPQLLRSDIRLKPSSTTPLQSLSMPSQTSGTTPPSAPVITVGVHSQPLDATLSASMVPRRHSYPHLPAAQVGAALGSDGQSVPQVPQLRMSVCRSGEVSRQV